MSWLGDAWNWTTDKLGDAKDTIFGSNELTEDEAARKKLLEEQARRAGGFANQSQHRYGQLSQDMDGVRNRLQQQMDGKDSIAREQLRQGVLQQQNAARSMAAGANPNNAAMAARTAANNMARANYGMSGQAALADMQERKNAAELLGNMTLGQRGQDLQASLESRRNAMTGYGAGQPFQQDKGWLEKYGPSIVGGINAVK